MIIRSVLISLVISTLALAELPTDSRLWVSQDGQYLRGKLVEVKDGNATLKDAAGQLVEVSLADLSIEDRKWALSFQKPVAADEQQPGETTSQSILTSRDGVELIPPPRPEPDGIAEGQPPVDPRPPAAVNADPEKADVVPKKLPKAIRNLRRLLQANSAPTADNPDGTPVFGPDSSVYVALSGKFLNEFIQVPIAQQQKVDEMIMGMPVAGTAATSGVATLFLQSSPDHAAFEIVVSGRADSLTSGGQMLVSVESDGTTHFEARKRIEISSAGFDLFEATATAQTTINKSAVSTELPGRIGFLVGRVVGRIVEANRPQIDYEASERAAYRAAKELDARIDSEVARVQQVLGEVAPGLAAGKPAVPIRFRTSRDTLAILIGEYEPAEWRDFASEPTRDGKDITVVLPKKTVATAKQLQMAMRLLSINLEDQLGGVKPEELTPTSQAWSRDKEWLTLTWDVDATVVELLSEDFLKATQTSVVVAKPTASYPPAQPVYSAPGVPSFNQGGLRRRGNVFRPLP